MARVCCLPRRMIFTRWWMLLTGLSGSMSGQRQQRRKRRWVGWGLVGWGGGGSAGDLLRLMPPALLQPAADALPCPACLLPQKWGFVATQPDAYLEFSVDTRAAAGPAAQQQRVVLSYLASYQGMGVARVECVGGCECKAVEIDALWVEKASMLMTQELKVGRQPQPTATAHSAADSWRGGNCGHQRVFASSRCCSCRQCLT